MKAMIFAAGLGTRLRPLTADRPKALVEVAGQTLLERNIQKLIDAGVNEMVVNIHHFGDKIMEFLQKNDNFGITIHVSDERDLLLDTGGGILKAREWFDGDDEPFVVHNVDIISDFDMTALLRAHHAMNADVTILVKSRATQRYLLFNGQEKLSGWVNKRTGEIKGDVKRYQEGYLHELAFSGVHVLSPTVFPALERYANDAGSVFSIIPFYVQQCSQLNIYGYQQATDYHWFDVGKPETLTQAAQCLSEFDK